MRGTATYLIALGLLVIGTGVFPEHMYAATITKFYFHDVTTTDTGTLPTTSTLSATAPNVTATGAGTNRSMDGTIGTLQTSGALTTLGQTTLQKNWFRRFVSVPLAAQTLPTGVWTIQGGASESNAASNMLVWGAVIKVWRPSTGAVVATLLDNPALGTLEPSTSETNESKATASITGVAVNAGDVLVVELWAQNTQGNTTARTNTVFYDGTTEGSATTNAAYLLAPAAITVQLPTVTTNSAEAISPTIATLFGAITNTGGANAIQSGFAYSTDAVLTTGVSTTTLGGQTGAVSFSGPTGTISANTTYYYRAYATNSAGTGYGSILSFATGNATPARKMRLFEGFKIKFVGSRVILYQN